MPTSSPDIIPKIEISASPKSQLHSLTEDEIEKLISTHRNGKGEELRRCALGIMHTGQSNDSTEALLNQYPDFGIEIKRSRQGIKFILTNVPTQSFIETNGELKIREAMRDHLCAVVRDLIYQALTIGKPKNSKEITDSVYKILRHAHAFEQRAIGASGEHIELDGIFCWGGHVTSEEEYKYAKLVGTELGLRNFEISTGGGPGGAMRGTHSGAMAAYKTERISQARHFGFNCPSIITSEPPNNIIDPLIIFPDVEKRLEAFIRRNLGGVIFPGGPGTAEEIQTILSILLHDKNQHIKYPLILTGPKSSKGYFEAIDRFLKAIFGDKIADKYIIIMNDPKEVAIQLAEQTKRAKLMREALEDENTWFKSMHIPIEVQQPFNKTHKSVEKLNLHKDQKPYELTANLRRLFSAIVFGNVSDKGTKMIKENGPFQVTGDASIINELDKLLKMFVEQNRMILDKEYSPCYELKQE